MSGGVDSSACATLLKLQNNICVGATMILHKDDDAKCSGSRDVLDAKRVCDVLKIPHYVSDFSNYFSEYVIDNFVKSYENGATPNPCIECNCHLKFSKLFDMASELGCDIVATGHYAKVEYDEKYGRCVLKKGKNEKNALPDVGPDDGPDLGCSRFRIQPHHQS